MVMKSLELIPVSADRDTEAIVCDGGVVIKEYVCV